MKHQEAASHPPYVRMALSYCERCGALRVHPHGASDRVCGRCAETLAWLAAEARR